MALIRARFLSISPVGNLLQRFRNWVDSTFCGTVGKRLHAMRWIYMPTEAQSIIDERRHSESSNVYVIDSRRVDAYSLDETCDWIVGRAGDRRSFYICTLNMDHLVKLRSDEAFRRIYKNAGLVTADGFPIVILARLDGLHLQRVTGADLVVPLCRAAAEKELSVYFLGPTQQAIDLCVARLKSEFSTLKVAGVQVAPTNFRPDGEDAARIAHDIRESGASLCFVGLGAPKQEFFSSFAAERVDGLAFIPVGAAIEFLAGTKVRAPRLARSVGMEWLWRLISEPRRLSGRYLASGFLFAELLSRRTRASGILRVENRSSLHDVSDPP